MKNRLLAALQLVTSPLLLIVFVVCEPTLIPEWPDYAGRCVLTVIDGERR